jgi:hypothetical protein
MAVTGCAVTVGYFVLLVQAVTPPKVIPDQHIVINGTSWFFRQSYVLDVVHWPDLVPLFGAMIFTLASLFAIPHDPIPCDFCGAPYRKADRKERMVLLTTPSRWRTKYLHFCSRNHMEEWLKK